MTVEESDLHETRWRRIRRVKRWLRPLPRRTNIHRYPILKLFAQAARKRICIWSFRVENAIPAIYGGSILTLLPIYGIQIPMALVLAILLRANLPIFIGLQIVSNPLTVLPLWLADYQVGRALLGVVGIDLDSMNRRELDRMLDQFIHGDWGNKVDSLSTVFCVTSFGAIVIGTFFGLIGSLIYRVTAKRTAASYLLLREKIHLHKSKTQSPSTKETSNDD